MTRQPWCIIQNLVVKYPLMVSYPQPNHNGTNVSYPCSKNRKLTRNSNLRDFRRSSFRDYTYMYNYIYMIYIDLYI